MKKPLFGTNLFLVLIFNYLIMNKKFFTFLAASCAAMTVNAQTITYNADGEVQTTTDYSSLVAGDVDARYPYTVMGTGAPTTKITALNTKAIYAGVAQDKLFQFMTADSKLLAMQWNDEERKYQVVLVDPAAAGQSYFIEETLWQVTAKMVGDSKALRYDLVNLGAQLPLQIKVPADDPSPTDGPTFVEGTSITWSWSEVASKDGGLSAVLSAAVDAQNSIVLVAGTDGAIKVKKYARTTATTPTGALSFKAYEANPIQLTAAQINAMMTGTKAGGKVQFSMDPEVAPADVVNPLTNGKFQAFEVVNANADIVGDAASYQIKNSKVYGVNTEEGYVVLAKGGKNGDDEIKNLLRVDTLYHNASLDGRYELKLTTAEIEAPREAYVLGTDLSFTDKKTVGNEVIKQMFNQAQFRFKYYPSDQSVLIQAYRYLYLDKESKQSWWKALLMADKSNITNGTYDTKWDTFFGTTYYPTVNDKTSLVDLRTASLTPSSNEHDALNDFLTNRDRTRAAFYRVEPTATTITEEWSQGMIRLTTLTSAPEHTEVTMGCDLSDLELGVDGYKGIKTVIRIGEPFGLAQAADIATGWYYIQSANTVPTDLRPSNYWWYADLAATNATRTVYDSNTEKWVVEAADYALEDIEAPRLVFSKTMLEKVPSAQWYFNGAAGAGFYTITNRESGRNVKDFAYFWKTKEAGVYVCKIGTTEYDTIRVVPAKMDALDGYMNISKEVANADTSVFKFNFVLPMMQVSVADKEGALQLSADAATEFKVERIKLTAKDKYTGKTVSYTDDLLYGYAPKPADQLKRALYRIYREDVNSNTTEATGERIREYVILEGGQYKLLPVKVTVKDGYVTSELPTSVKSFYIKNMTNNANEFVLVDPETTETTDGMVGVRVFVNQLTSELQPAGLKSQGASNVFDNSLFSFEKVAKLNYRDVRTNADDTDTLVFFKAANPEIKLYESAVEGANVTLLNRDNYAQYDDINAALFVDTAYLQNAAKPVFLLGLRPSQKVESGSNIEEHNRVISTTADYLMVLADSAKVNKAYLDRYNNVRLGFVNATHKVDGENTLTLNNEENKVYNLNALKDKLCPATFAFRYADADRDNFYIETAKENGEVNWIKVINEVPVIVNDIKEAEMYNVVKATTAPTANEAVEAAEVTVVAEAGAIVVKGAAGKVVTVANILGQTIANQVAASDNVTIAAPAGVAVVTVDGQAVKVVVK